MFMACPLVFRKLLTFFSHKSRIITMSFKIRDEHWEVLVSFFEEHPELARGSFIGPNSREKLKKLWAELATRFNALGFGERSPDKWQKSWTDIKYLIKKKAVTSKREQTRTGGGPSTSTPFNKFELRIICILGESFLHGVGETEVGQASNLKKFETVQFRKPPVSDVVKEHSPVPSTSDSGEIGATDHTYSFTPKAKKRKTEESVEEQAYFETISVLKDIKNVIDARLGEISAGLKTLNDTIKSSFFPHLD